MTLFTTQIKTYKQKIAQLEAELKDTEEKIENLEKLQSVADDILKQLSELVPTLDSSDRCSLKEAVLAVFDSEKDPGDKPNNHENPDKKEESHQNESEQSETNTNDNDLKTVNSILANSSPSNATQTATKPTSANASTHCQTKETSSSTTHNNPSPSQNLENSTNPTPKTKTKQTKETSSSTTDNNSKPTQSQNLENKNNSAVTSKTTNDKVRSQSDSSSNIKAEVVPTKTAENKQNNLNTVAASIHTQTKQTSSSTTENTSQNPGNNSQTNAATVDFIPEELEPDDIVAGLVGKYKVIKLITNNNPGSISGRAKPNFLVKCLCLDHDSRTNLIGTIVNVPPNNIISLVSKASTREPNTPVFKTDEQKIPLNTKVKIVTDRKGKELKGQSGNVTSSSLTGCVVQVGERQEFFHNNEVTVIEEHKQLTAA